jgi:hypothetical protein
VKMRLQNERLVVKVQPTTRRNFIWAPRRYLQTQKPGKRRVKCRRWSTGEAILERLHSERTPLPAALHRKILLLFFTIFYHSL